MALSDIIAEQIGHSTPNRTAGIAVVAFLCALSKERRIALGIIARREALLPLGRCLPDNDVNEQGPPSSAQAAVQNEGESLGIRRFKARRPDRGQLEKLLRDSHPWVIARLLENPTITELDVRSIAAHRKSSSEILQTIAAHPKFIVSPVIRRTLLLNPKTEPSLSMPMLCLCPRNELKEVARLSTLAQEVRNIAWEWYLQKIPFVGMTPSEELQ